MKNNGQTTLLRKVQLSITAVTFVTWSIILALFEIKLLTTQGQMSNSGYSNLLSFVGIEIPFWLHLGIVLLIASMVMWLVLNMGELLGLYSKELSSVKKKINEATADKE